MDRKLRTPQHLSRLIAKKNRLTNKHNFAKKTQDFPHWMHSPTLIQVNKSTFMTMEMYSKPIKKIRPRRRKSLAKKRLQIEHWMQILTSTKQQTLLRSAQHLDVQPTIEEEIVAKLETNDNEDSLSDVDIEFEDLAFISDEQQSIELTAEEHLPEDRDRTIAEEDFSRPFPTPPPETENRPSQPVDLFHNTIVNISTNEFVVVTPPQSPTSNRRGESLSDVSVDLDDDDLESIPEDFVIPMFNEDGAPSDSDSGSDTPSDTNHNTPREMDPYEPTIRDLMIEVQGDDRDVHMEEDLFDIQTPRSPLTNITVASPSHNEADAVIPPTSTWIYRLENRILQLREIRRRRIHGDHTGRIVWPRQHSNQENVRLNNENEQIEWMNMRERVWAQERDEMIVGWNEGQNVREERDREWIVRREWLNVVTPSQNSWTRSMR